MGQPRSEKTRFFTFLKTSYIKIWSLRSHNSVVLYPIGLKLRFSSFSTMLYPKIMFSLHKKFHKKIRNFEHKGGVRQLIFQLSKK